MDWLTEMVERYGVIRIVLGVVVSAAGAITGLAAALGGGAVGVSWVLAGLLFLSLLFIAALVVSLRRQHQQEQMLRWALGSLRQYIHATSRLVSETLLEREEIHINRRGDGTWRGILTERVAPASPSPLHFIRWDLGGESLREREQRKMQFSVRALPGGGRLPFEVEWTSNRDVILWVHLVEPIPPGDQITIELRYTWPRQFPGLARGGVERVELGPTLRPTRSLELVVVLEKDHGVTRSVKHTHSGFLGLPTQAPDGGNWRIEASAANLSPGQVVWLALDLT